MMTIIAFEVCAAFVLVYVLGIVTGIVASRPDKPKPDKRECKTCKHAKRGEISDTPECWRCMAEHPGAGYDRRV